MRNSVLLLSAFLLVISASKSVTGTPALVETY